MAEYVAGRGTTALGIIGTILGGLAVGGGTGLLNGRTGAYESSYATMHDIDDVKQMAEKDAEIQSLKMAQSTDAKIIDTYKELQSQINAMKEQAANRWTEQMVTNSQLTSAVNVNTNNLIALQSKVDGFTKVVIPTTSVCNTNCGCNCNM